MTSLALSAGMRAIFMPDAAAASSLAVTPPTGRTFPLTLREPVMARSWRIGMFSSAEMMTVAMVMDAESPSTPSYVPMYCRWMSLSDRLVIVYFLMTAEMFSTASLAMVPSCPVATMCPALLTWDGDTSATIGSTIPERFRSTRPCWSWR